jgi:membrane protein YqaA with SNARE-associated domain
MEALALWFQESLLPYGAWGLLLLAALDSSFLPMPAFIDLAVMGAAALAPENAVGFALGAIAGSTVGVLAVYGLARSGRYVARGDGGRLAWAEQFLAHRGAVALLVAALMPAPFPFKVVVLASGYLRQPLVSVVLGVGAGRLLRFGAEAFLAARYGDEIIAAVQTNAPMAGLITALIIGIAGFAFYRWQQSVTTARHE